MSERKLSNQYYNLNGVTVNLQRFKSAKVVYGCRKGWYVKVSYGLFSSVESNAYSQAGALEAMRYLTDAVNKYHREE